MPDLAMAAFCGPLNGDEAPMLYPILALSVALAGDGASVSVGAAARAFSLPAANGGQESVSLFDYTGLGAPKAQDAVIVHFFEKAAGDDVLSSLSAMDERRPDVKVIGVMSDVRGLSSVSAWISGQDLAFPVLFDEHRVIFQRYGVAEPPITIVIDGDGYVHAVGRPQGTAFVDELEAILAPLTGD